jgi:hypothetical protein
MLNLLYEVIERAIKKDWSSINKQRVRQVAQTLPPEMPKDDSDTQQLPSAKVDLTGEGDN